MQGGIHGNEVAGIHAIKGVLKQLNHNNSLSSKGELIGLKGNLSELEKGVRYVNRNMNQ